MSLKAWATQKTNLDKVFSIFIRLRGSKNEYNQCFTCGNFFHFKNLQAGHYITRNNLSVRWDERNVQPQCKGCNLFGGGKPQIYALRLKEKYGEGILEELDRKKNLPSEINKWNILEYIDKYKKLVKDLGL